MKREIAVGDIHGNLKAFLGLLAQLKLTQSDTLILLGDYIDRGANSKGVLDEIIKLKKEHYNVIALMGNHEEMLLSDHHAEVNLGYGSMADKNFLKSFKIESLKELPLEYIDFCKKLP